ncbi:unnamed protein product [Cuscuta epithymum]|uniref:Uncharacterized protein n=1 Tax=Cuscuta epithymum TaxID=186058 RepID=A0AAV0CYK3_9ASTE|nr:unnamed protein product [Cuscuta epithymum]
MAQRVYGRSAGSHGGGGVDDVGVPASGAHHVLDSGRVEVAGGVEIEVELVGLDSRLEHGVEVVGEVGGGGDVAKVMEVLLEPG